MTIREANQILRNYYRTANPSEDMRFLYTEALAFLIEETKDSNYMVDLGSMYYEQQQYDLALKYYEMAAEYDNLYAISNLGYIWYYGRTGERNYEKAFYYYDRAQKMGDVIAAYKVADMYKNGYYVEKDYEEYKSIIEGLYHVVKNARRPNDPLPEVFTRLARIRTEEGDTQEALRLYGRARSFLERRIAEHPFFGDLNIMKWMVEDIYRLKPLDREMTGLYDLYELLKTPVKVRFIAEEEPHEVEAVEEGGQLVIRMDDQWFRTVDDFFRKAEVDGELLTSIYDELQDFEVV